MDRNGRAPAWRRVMAALLAGMVGLSLAACGGGGGGAPAAPAQPGGQTTAPPPAPDVGIAITAITGSPALVGAEIRFTAQAAAGTAPFTYAWDFGDGATASGGSEARHAYAAAGSYAVSITVTDARGKTATARSEVRVEAPLSVGITASQIALSVNQAAQLTATHEPTSDVLRYEWKLGDGRTAEGPAVSVSYGWLGTFPVELVVVRKNGFKSTASLTLSTVSHAPSISAGFSGLAYSGVDVTLSVLGNAAQGRVLWDFGDGVTQEADIGSTTHRYREPGQYVVRATQTNATGAAATASLSLTLLAPVSPSAVTVTPYQPLRNTQAASATVSVTGVSASRTGDSELERRYSWDFGDGSPAVAGEADRPLEHSFPGPGTYIVTLTATNVFGLRSSGSATVVVGQRQQVALLAGRDLARRKVDGPALTATFDQPAQLSFDAAGNLFIVDAGNAAVRKLSRDGVVSTVDTGGMDCRRGSRISSFSIAAHGDGGLMAAPWAPDCSHDTLWDMRPGAAPVNVPVPPSRLSPVNDDDISGMAVNPSGRLLALFSRGTVLRRLEADGTWVDVAGKAYEWQRTDGVGADARILAHNQQLGIDGSGAVYYAGVTTVHRIAADGTVRLIAGEEYQGVPMPSLDGIGPQARFSTVSALAAAHDGTVIVLERNKLRKIAPDGMVTTLPVDLSIHGYPDSWSAAVAVAPDGTIVVADRTLNIVRRVNSDGTLTIIAGRLPVVSRDDGVGEAAGFNRPQGIAQGASGVLYVADGDNRAVRKVSLDGTVTTLATIPTPPVYLVNGYPSLGGLVVDAEENVYVADTATNTIRKVTPDGTVTLVAGMPGSNGWRDGPAGSALFNAPVGIARDGDGNLYVSDAASHVIRKITPAGVVSTVAGTAFAPGLVDGVGAAGRFNRPTALVADLDGTLWVSDTDNMAIRKVTPAGEVSTVAGRGEYCYTWEETAPEKVCVNQPEGLARDAGSGDLYYVEASDGGLRQLKPDGKVYQLAGAGGSTRVRLGAMPSALLGAARGIALLSNGQIAVTTGNLILITTN